MQTTSPGNLVMAAALAGLLTAPLPAAAQSATADVDPPVIEHIEDTTTVEVTAPTNTWLGTRGLSHTPSAEALGEGRLVLGIAGPWYRQERAFTGVPNENADIFTGRASAAIGFNRHVDGFATLSWYGSNNYASPKASGLGTYGGGIQGTLPFTPTAPIRMGAMLGVFEGVSENQVNLNEADGYNYFETRTGLDFHARLMQSLVFGSEDAALKLHLNEGLVTSMEDGRDPLLLTGIGMQMNLPVAVLGLELNSRTQIDDIDLTRDPLWITPSVQFRTGYNLNLSVGGDISLSEEREGPAQRALEPYRLFGGLFFTFDTHEEKRRQERMEAWRKAQERRKLEIQNAELARRAREADVQVNTVNIHNQALSEKARQDSLALVEKIRQDSLALAEQERLLAEERSKRSDLETQLLTTGMLVLDAVYFETARTDISINSKPYLDMLGKMLTKYPKLRIEVAGHTDSKGSEAYNLNLSQGRAASVMSYLISREPNLAGRLTAQGYGEARPKADNSTAEGRMHNRRTELQVLNKEALEEYNRPAEQARGPSGE